MNLNFNKGNGKEVENVSIRVKKTKQEIEQLKSELEKLINLGNQPSYHKPPEKKTADVETPSLKPVNLFSLNLQPKNNAAATQKRVEPAKTNPPKSVPVVQKKPEPVKVSPSKKTRNYNVVEAREYIKKQREKRTEQLKAQINVADNQLDLKKQKLKELHLKTLELVTKNVQLKRERSKSRDREPPVRLDKSNPRHKSQETIPKPCQRLVSKSQDRLKPPASCTGVKLQDRAKSQDRSKSQETKKSQDRSKSQEKAKSQAQVKTSPKERVSRPRTREPAGGPPGQKIDPKFLYPPNAENVKTDIDLEKTGFPPSDDIVDLNKKITSEPNVSLDEKVEDKRKNPRPKKHKTVLEHSIMTDACLKDTKETQTSRAKNFEGIEWMQPPPALPYPYNFINTVKRKLQFAINSPKSCVDVGVQNSDASFHTPEVDKVKSKEEIKQMLIKSASEVRSFASHRGPNLDLKAVENLELVPNKLSKEPVSKNLFDTYDSESDTSKNIPELSSESLESLQSKPKLSLDKVKDLKLVKIADGRSDKTDTNGYPDLEVDSYSSDFQNESNETSKSKSSTIRTVASDRKISDTVNQPSISRSIKETSYKPSADFTKNKSQEISETSIGTSMTSYNVSTTSSRHTESQSHNINKDPRNGDSQKSFKSLLTESQISKSRSAVETSKSESITESLDLKQPSVSFRNPRKNFMNAITVRSRDDSNLANLENGSFTSLMREDKISKGTTESVPESLDQEKSSASKVESLSLKEPTVSLVVGKERKREDVVKSQMKNITLRPVAAQNNVNEIHLKFEAEVRLLNDFNESFKQFVAVEKAFENLKTKNETNLAMTKIFQNVDTQTSVIAKTSVSSPRDTRNSSINFSRGSEIIEDLNEKNASKSLQNSTFSTDWNLSNLNNSSITSMDEEGKSRLSISSVENFNAKNCASILSLNLVDQLIKDEDTRIQQLKAIIKIREQALLDRTKSELVWLEIQKKQLIETGKIEEASLLKKKQRGIIVKHEQERNEIKKLKQKQKERSEQRKSKLQQERNFIKTQLSTEDMLAKITVKKQRKERRSTGPLRVVQSRSDETSISLRSSGIEDVLSITSKSLRVSEESEAELKEEVPVSSARRTLLMREAALQRRRRAAEELLRWHRRLLDEERKIGELEAAAASVARDRHSFDGRQLNQLWRSMTGTQERRFVEDKVYAMSQLALERLCRSARRRAAHAPKPRAADEGGGYSSAFEQESGQEIKISSISELIDNFSRIEDEISTLSKKAEDIVSLKDGTEDSDVSSIRDEPSVVENKDASRQETEQSIEEIVTKDEDLQVQEQDQKITTDEEVSTGKDVEVPSEKDLEEAKVREESITIEENIATDESVSEVEDLDLKSTPEHGVTDEQVSEPKESLEEVPTRVVVEEHVSTIEEDLEQPEAEDTVVTSIEDKKTINKQASIDEDVEVQKSPEDQKTSDEQISTKEDLEESKSPEDLEVVTEQISKTSEVVEELTNQKLLDESSSTQYVDELPKQIGEEEVTSDVTSDVTTKDEESRKSEVSTIEEESVDRKSDDDNGIEDKEVSSESIREESVEAASKDLAKSLSLEEALESACKIEESLSKLNEKLVSVRDEEISEVSTGKEVESIEDASKGTSKSVTTSVATETEEKTPQKKNLGQIDVKKRVSEILADASPSRGDKSPRLQDLYVTAYDVTPVSAEFNEPLEEGRQMPTDIFGSEAEELWRKQLAIEQEIKQIELQQKEQLPYLYMREIPNKPPPPYTPPSSLSSLPQSILPSEAKEITEIASYSSKVLYKAHQNATLHKVKFSENGFKLFSKVEVSKMCAEFVFNICRDIARDHYKQFEEVEEPSWLVLAKKPQLAKTKPANADALERMLNQKLKELFGFKKAQVVESAIVKWGRKKRDHVDEVLVVESQEEESQWTNFDRDELIVKNQVCEDIMKMLLEETAGVFAEILSKKKCVVG